MKLRDYQNTLVNDTRKAFAKGYKLPLVVLPCGGGKTVCFADMANKHVDKVVNGHVWFLVHRRELVDQTLETFEEFKIPTDNIFVGMVQSITRNPGKFKKPTFIIFDECFPGNTKVNGRRIDNIKHGDIITSYNHSIDKTEEKKVTHIFKSVPSGMIIIKSKYGEELICTPNHPIYTKRGYVNACELQKNDGMYLLRERSYKGTYGKSKIQGEKRESLLFGRMHKKILFRTFFKNNGSNKFSLCFRKNEEKQSNVKSDNEKKSIGHIKKNRSSSKNKRWKWNWINSASRIIVKCIKEIKSIFRICCTDKNKTSKRWNANVLQDRYSYSEFKNSNRSGWWKSPIIRKTISRFKENTFFKKIRVESVEIQKQTSDGTFGGLCPDGYVYNLEVEDNNNYFAKGFLVHNCHHAKAKSWYNIIDYFNDVPMVGLTATPERADGKTLGDVFDVMVEGVESDWLIKNGYLSKYKYYAPPVTDMEFKMKNIDYDLDEFSSQLLKSKIYGSISKYINPQKKTIIYCPTIEFSKYLCEQTGATHFDGKTPAKERKQIVDDFKSGKIMALSNVNLIGEGFDVPDCDTVLLLRPTQSLALFIQQSMRCLRPQPGKEAVIYDLVGNVYRHGLPTEPHIWSLTAKRKRLKNNTSEEIIVRRCGRCMLVYSGLGKVCPYCGFDNGKTRKQIEHERAIELEEIKKINKAKYRRMVAMATTHKELTDIGISRGYQYPKKWASMLIASRRKKKFRI
jgi:superfamily II DNA or RNA helicase/intein/homing endonuclease